MENDLNLISFSLFLIIQALKSDYISVIQFECPILTKWFFSQSDNIFFRIEIIDKYSS